jgi:hypothetical protein
VFFSTPQTIFINQKLNQKFKSSKKPEFESFNQEISGFKPTQF